MNSDKISNNDKQEISQLKLTSEEEDRLYRRSVLESLQSELLSWAKKRFWIIAIIAILLGWIGVTVVIKDLIRQELREATRAGAIAETAADQASKAAQKVSEELEKYRHTIENLSNEAMIVSEELKNTKESLLFEKGRIEADASHAIAKAQLKVENIEQKLTDLSNLVIIIANKTQLSQENLAQYETDIDRLRKDQLSNESKFKENSNYKISVASKQDQDSSLRSALVYKRLVREGFKVTRDWFRSNAVFLGDHIVIQHSFNSSKKANEVKEIVAEVLGKQNNIVVSETPYLNGNRDDKNDVTIQVLLDVDEKRVSYNP